MRLFKNFGYSLLFIFISIKPLKAQINDYTNFTFERLSIEDGLSQITVHSILQDSKGFMWFGTEDGLNRYDGYNFTVYRYNPSDTGSISDNFIWSIFEDHKNNIWIGTNNGGLNKYDYESDSFEKYLNNNTEINNIRVIFEDREKNLWIGTETNGLYKSDKNEGSFQEVIIDSTRNLSIRAICEDNDGSIWIGTNQNGLYNYKPGTDKFANYNMSNSRIRSQAVLALVPDSLNNIWIGTYKSGLAKFDSKLNKIININGRSGTDIVNGNITSFLIDDLENLWICTEGGLSIYNDSSKLFKNYRYNPSDLRSLSNSLLRSIYQDNSNLIWIGTLGGGVNKLNLKKKFNQYNHNPSEESSLSNNIIRAIEEDAKGNLWIGTLGSGINRLDRETNYFSRIDSRSIGLRSNVVTSILEDRKKNLWIGTWGGGLNFIQLTSNYDVRSVEVFINSPKNMNSISSNIIQDIFEDSRGNLWIGTENGLNKYDADLEIFDQFKFDSQNEYSISDNRVQSRCIIEDRLGSLWIGTWNGLNKINIDKHENNSDIKFVRFFKEDGLSDNRIISLYEDPILSDSSKLILWVGTIGGGLNKMIIKNTDNGDFDYSFFHLDERDGLPSNVIYGIIGDDESNLWLSTNNGLSRFDTQRGTFKNFNVDDGLQSNQFFWGAFHKTKDGELYFGGINGLNSFFPDQLLENTNIPPVYISSCIIESTDGKYYLVLNNIDDINYDSNIELPYNSYNLQFEYTALDYTTPSKNTYKIKLENYEEDWRAESFSNNVKYNNIHQGEYIFKVVGSNNDGIWNDSGSSFVIVIQTPFWKTWWFILLLSLSIIGFLLLFVTNQIKNALALERLRTKLAADLHDNIGSSLTEISILSEVISTRIKSSDKEIIKNLEGISHKSRSLIDKMSDIVWLVNPQRDTLYDLILRLQDTYSDLLSDTEISFVCKNLKSLENVTLSMENRQHLFLIFKEAINNSINHSECSELVLIANVSGKKLTMSLKDNGKGFNPKNEKNGNGLNNMKSRSAKIGGTLSVKSDIGFGTIVEYIGNIK